VPARVFAWPRALALHRGLLVDTTKPPVFRPASSPFILLSVPATAVDVIVRVVVIITVSASSAIYRQRDCWHLLLIRAA
jgi:hypothetical protein